MSRLPSAEAAIVADTKITRYLLNPDHREGGPKARFFLAFGFNRENPALLAEALRQHPLDHPLVDTRLEPFGAIHIVDCSIRTPDQRNPCVRTIWITEDGSPGPRLVTAYPAR